MSQIKPQYFIRLTIGPEFSDSHERSYFVGPFDDKTVAGIELDRASLSGNTTLCVRSVVNRTNAQSRGLAESNTVPGPHVPASAEELFALLDKRKELAYG